MAFKVEPRAQPRRRLGRAEILRRLVTLACAWIGVQGLVLIVLDVPISGMLRIRYGAFFFPLVKTHGVALATLAFYLWRSLKEPERQTLALDTLILYLLGVSSALLISYHYGRVTPYEWTDLGVSLVLAGLLIIFRTTATMEKAARAMASPDNPK